MKHAGKEFSPLRRRLIAAAPLVVLAGCDASPEGKTESFLRSFQGFNDWVQAKMFSPRLLAPEYAEREVTPLEGFRPNSYDTDTPDIDFEAWRLEVRGMVAHPGSYTIEQIRTMPRRAMATRHVCVEGWSMIPKWGGTPLAGFLDLVGADPKAQFISVRCGDGYYSGIDMPSARHPQTLLCYEAYGAPLSLEHGAPLRIVLPTKLGYKQPKWITEITVTNDKPGGYWEDQGYDWFGGI